MSLNFSDLTGSGVATWSRRSLPMSVGLNAELYYIREGVVNDYAMRFSVKVPPKIHSIFFRWEALSKRPVLYNMAVWINETSVKDSKSPIGKPSLNISLSGTIPKKTETFQLNLPCTGLLNGEVGVILNLNVTSPRPNQPPTVLYFNRRKICLKGIAAERLLPRKSLRRPKDREMKSEGEEEEGEEGVEEEEEEENLPVFVYIVYGLASLGLVIAVLTAVACWKAFEKTRKYPFPAIHQPVFVNRTQSERKSSSSLQKSSHSQENNIYTSPSAVYTGPSGTGTYTIPSALTGNSYASVYKFPFQSTDITGSLPPCKCTDSSCSGIYESSCCSNSNSKSESYFSSKNSKEEEKYSLKFKYDKICETSNGFGLDVSNLKERFRQLQMDRERVRLTEVVQEGKTGRVYKGFLQREHPELDQQVVIKTLREGSPPEEIDTLCEEGTVLSGLHHQNLMCLVGMSFTCNSPPFLIYPDPQGRNFKLFLRSWPLKVLHLVEVCLQAARGICFLHASHILHKDIAARNCIISDHLQLRLTDSALSRDFFPEDYEGWERGTDGGTETVTDGDTRGGRGLLPIRWMAPETLKHHNQVSSSSDVWSLGVLLWEASTQSERPYCSVSSDTLCTYLKEGQRLLQSPTCPDDLHRLMSACWGIKPQHRPTAQQVVEFLSSFKQSLTAFV